MAAIQSPESFLVKSHLGQYRVDFVADPVGPFAKDRSGEHMLVIDRCVNKLHGKRLGVTGDDRTIPFEAKEENKNLAAIPALVEEILGKGVTKKTRLVVVGGGITQDVGAFAASIVFRGLPWVFYPTTLLAQADSCIGSKTSINVGSHKNQAGGFYPPERVVVSSQFLDTLSAADLRSGYGEIIKVHLLKGENGLDKMETSYHNSYTDSGLRERLVRESLLIKKPYVEEDEFDVGRRNLLNYGHTFGHALETATAFRLPHGQAVTVGMDIANFLSWKWGLMPEEVFYRIRSLLRMNFPAAVPGLNLVPEFIRALRADKKNSEGRLVAILARGPGSMEKTTLPFDQELEKEIIQYFETLNEEA